jgi:hypothetical protein
MSADQQQTAALPWADSGPQLQSDGGLLREDELDIPASLSMQLGRRLEVCWQLEDDSGQATTKVVSNRSAQGLYLAKQGCA